MDETKELTIDDLRRMVEDAGYHYQEMLTDASRWYSEEVGRLHHQAVEAGLMQEGDMWPWIKPTPYRTPEYKDMAELRPPEIDKSQS